MRLYRDLIVYISWLIMSGITFLLSIIAFLELNLFIVGIALICYIVGTIICLKVIKEENK